MPEKHDDLDAVRTLVETLEGFDSTDQERILRWAREKLSLPVEAPAQESTTPPRLPAQQPAGHADELPRGTDIKSFVNVKQPSSNNDFAAMVAYYYRFEAPEEQRKEFITAADLQEACRLTGRERLPKPSQTLVHAYTAGLLEKGERGAYSISTVGENLVAVTLPLQPGESRPKRRQAKKASPKKPAARAKQEAAAGRKMAPKRAATKSPKK